MQAKELVSILERQNPDISRQDLLEQVNYVHRMMLSKRMLINRASDSTTGVDPKITPTTVEYDLSTVDSNANWIDRVYKTKYECPLDVNKIYGTTIVFKKSQLGREYFVRYYKKAADILVETDELQVPDEDIDVLEDGVNAYLEKVQHGSREAFAFWKQNDMKKWQWKNDRQYKWNGGIDG